MGDIHTHTLISQHPISLQCIIPSLLHLSLQMISFEDDGGTSCSSNNSPL